MKSKMADALERDREAKFEQILEEILLELEDKGRKITFKDEQRKAVKQLYGKKDLVAVLPTGFRKSLIFQLLMFSRRMVACVVDESHTIETWTNFR